MGCAVSSSAEPDRRSSFGSSVIYTPSFGGKENNKGRDLSAMKTTHKTLSTSRKNDGLFIDAEFPPESCSISRTNRKFTQRVVWKRPWELSQSPVLISDGTSRHDMKQGDLNDCWFLSTLSAIAEKPQLMTKRPPLSKLHPHLVRIGIDRSLNSMTINFQKTIQIIPKEVNFRSRSYKGRFHCRFWQFGEWVDVSVDDTIPTVDGQILFAHSSDPNEFWVSLIEKAYAKLNKSYEALEYGYEGDAFTDLTGGLAEWYNPIELKDQDFYLIRAAYQSGAVIGCLSRDNRSSDNERKTGMISNHSYVVTSVEEIPYSASTAQLIRIRNPWGETEWKGPWSDGEEEWLKVPDVIKLELEVTSQDDGEFWMSYNDFRQEYCNMIICNISPDFDHDGISDKAECQLMFRGSWQGGLNAGGWMEYSTFCINPHYIVTLYRNAQIERSFDGKVPFVASLMQIYHRWQKLEDSEMFAIGVEVFRIDDDQDLCVDAEFYERNDPIQPENEETYAKTRDTSGRFFLHPGSYLLIPTTQLPNQQRDYVLRLYSVSYMECRPLVNCIEPP